MPFSKNDHYYNKELDDFFGDTICKFDEEKSKFLDRDGINFTLDRYREWLMKVLIANECYNIDDAMKKYPFIKNDISNESSEDESSEDESNEDESSEDESSKDEKSDENKN
jgi:hypothetical protein